MYLIILVWDINSVALLSLSPCVLIKKYLHVASLDLDLVVLSSTSASEFSVEFDRKL